MTAATTAAMIAATVGRAGATTEVTGGMTAATGAPAPGCCGDSSNHDALRLNRTRSAERVHPLDDRIDPSHEGRTPSD